MPTTPTSSETSGQPDHPVDHYRLMIDSIDDYAISMLDPAGNVTSWNPGAELITGYTAGEIIGRHFSIFYLPEDITAGKPQSVLQHALADRRYEEEVEQLRKDGKKFWALATITALFDQSGNHIGFAEVTHDITEKRRREQRLLQKMEKAYLTSEARYQKLFHYSQEGIVIADAQSFYLDANPSMCRMLGYARNELIGLHASDIVIQEEVQHIGQAMRDTQHSGHHREWRLRRKDSSIFQAEVLATQMPDGTLLGIIRDTSDPSMVRTEKHSSEELIDGLPGVLYFYDSMGHFLRWNRNFETVTGYSGAEIARMHPRDFFLDHDKSQLEERIAEVFEKGESTLEALLISKNGIAIPYFFTGKRVEFDGEMCLLGVGIDMSDRRVAQERLAESEKRYRELVEYANSIILRWSSDGRITFLNRFGQKLFGYTAEEILGRHLIGTIVPVHETSARDLAELMEFINNNPTAFERNTNENILRNGDRVWISWTNRILRDSHGRVVEFLSIGTEIGRKGIEEESERSHRAPAS